MSNYYNRQWRLPNNENKTKQSNYSMDFDGSSYIDAGTGLGDDLGTYTGDLTISFWINRFTAANSKGILYFGSFSNARGVLEIYADTSSITILSGGNKVLSYTNANTWDNICIIYKSGDISNSKIYLNGSEQSTTDSGSFSSSLIFTGKKTIIGGYYGSAYTFNGKIDGVSIYNYELSASQITTLYGSSSTGIGNPMSLSPKPVAYYPLGDQDSFNGADYLVPNSSLKDYVFDFNNDNVLFNTLNLGTQSTESFWVKRTTSNSNLWLGRLGPSGSNEGGYPLYLTSSIIYTRITTGGGSKSISFSTPNDTWMHVCRVRNGNNVSVYVSYNGTFNQNSGTNNFAAFTGLENEDTIISEFTGGSANVYEASNWQFFNTALSSTDVETLYNNGSPLTSMSGFTSLQGWWKLDASATYDGSNWTIPDDSTNSNDGTSSGMTQANLVQSDLSFTSGYSPYALDFDGTNDYIDCGTSQLLDFSSSFTISAWVYITSTASGLDCVYAFKGASYAFVFKLNNYATYSPISFGIANDAADGTIKCATNVTINKWNNIVVVYNGNGIATPSNYTFYIDNTSQTLTTSGGFSDNGNVNYIGRYASSHSFTGSISNISVWNAALTSSQVTEIYSEGVPSNLNNHSAYSNLVSWWQLGSNSSFNTNWTVLDEKGSNNGTSVNMTEADIVDGVGSYANGLSSGMSDNVVGNAPFSDANSLSVNMDVEDRTTDTPS